MSQLTQDVQNIIKNIYQPTDFLLHWEQSFNSYTKAMDALVELYRTQNNDDDKMTITKAVDIHFNFVFNYITYVAELNNKSSAIKQIHQYNHTLNLDRSIGIYPQVDMSILKKYMNEQNSLPILRKISQLNMTQGNWRQFLMNDEKKIYSSLSDEQKEEAISLITSLYDRYDDNFASFELWKKSEILKGLFLKDDIDKAFKEVCLHQYQQHSSITTEKYSEFKKTYFYNLMTKNKDEKIQNYVYHLISNYQWRDLQHNSYDRKHARFLETFIENKEYDKWLNLVKKFDTLLATHANENNTTAIPYLRYQTLPVGIIEYVVKEGTYEDFKTIQPFMTEDSYDFNYSVWYQNQEHKLEQSPLYELVLRSKKREFQEFLSHYNYINENLADYIEKQPSALKFKKNILFKDELATLFNVLHEHQEYSMLESLNEFKNQHTVQNQGIKNIPKPVKSKKQFSQSIWSFFQLLIKKKTEQKLISQESQHIEQATETIHIAKNHAEFVHELNEYSKLIQDKLTFLRKKIKISASLDTFVKDEICEDIESIANSSLMIEKVLEKQYSVRHVEEYVRYKALTGKYFVQAVEQYLEFTTELKNDLKENDDSLKEYFIQFREQVGFIKTSLEEIKNVLKSDRQNDLLAKMKSDTQLLRLKQNA
jgi:hypothetical protein